MPHVGRHPAKLVLGLLLQRCRHPAGRGRARPPAGAGVEAQPHDRGGGNGLQQRVRGEQQPAAAAGEAVKNKLF